MSSNLKSDTAGINGATSKGAITPERIAQSSQNAALRHGLTANSPTLRTESDDDFQILLDSYLDLYHPAGRAAKQLQELENREVRNEPTKPVTRQSASTSPESWFSRRPDATIAIPVAIKCAQPDPLSNPGGPNYKRAAEAACAADSRHTKIQPPL
jgi:hypothetical protein